MNIRRVITYKTPPPRLPLLYWLPSLARVEAEYPAELLEARRASFVEQIRNYLEQRLAAIDDALGKAYDQETINNLLEEKASILIELEKE